MPIQKINLKNIFLICLIAIISACLFAPGLCGPFLLDDLQSIEVAKLSEYSFQDFFATIFYNDTGPLARPISVASFIAVNELFGLTPFAHKAVNLVLHLIIGLLVYLVSLQLTKYVKINSFSNKTFALIIAFIWLIHPIQVSTVLYAVQRMTQLSHLFILLGILFHLKFRKYNSLILTSVNILVATSLAALCKETGALLPFYILITEFFIIKSENNKTIIPAAIISLGVIILAITYFIIKLDYFLALYSEQNITILQRLLTQTQAIVFYAKLIWLPQLSQMGLFHDDMPILREFNPWNLRFLVVILAGVYFILRTKNKYPLIAFGLSWFFVSHLIESSVIPLEQVFEHRNYLSLMGLIIVPVAIADIILAKYSFKLKRYFIGFFALTLILLSSITFYRSYIWGDQTRFIQNQAAFHPMSVRAKIELANLAMLANQPENALIHLFIAQTLQPNNPGITLHQLLIFCVNNKFSDRLLNQATDLLKTGRINPYTLIVMDQIITKTISGQCNQLTPDQLDLLVSAIEQNKFVKHHPKYVSMLYQLSAGVSYLKNNLPKAQKLLLDAYKIYPKSIDPLITKAYFELRAGDYSQSLISIELAKNEAKFYTKRAKIKQAEFLLKQSVPDQYKYQYE